MDVEHEEREEWMYRLKHAYDAGYYRTEAAPDEQEGFPWQGKSCRDCPFWLRTEWCQVHSVDRLAPMHTCSYFDAPHQPAGRTIIERRERESRKRFLDWLSGQR